MRWQPERQRVEKTAPTAREKATHIAGTVPTGAKDNSRDAVNASSCVILHALEFDAVQVSLVCKSLSTKCVSLTPLLDCVHAAEAHDSSSCSASQRALDAVFVVIVDSSWILSSAHLNSVAGRRQDLSSRAVRSLNCAAFCTPTVLSLGKSCDVLKAALHVGALLHLSWHLPVHSAAQRSLSHLAAPSSCHRLLRWPTCWHSGCWQRKISDSSQPFELMQVSVPAASCVLSPGDFSLTHPGCLPPAASCAALSAHALHEQCLIGCDYADGKPEVPVSSTNH